MKSIKINQEHIPLSQELAEICGIHVGDGYLRNDGKRRELDISGNLEEKDYYDKHMIPLFNKLFNLNIKGRFFPSRNTYGFVIRDRKVIEFVHNVLKFPYGNKSLKVQLPDFVFNNPNLICGFLRGYFDTDGHFSCVKKYGKYIEFKKKFHFYPRLMFSTVSNPLSNDLRNLFEILGIKFYFRNYQPTRKTESLKYIYEINGSKRVQKFINLIKPKNPTKISRYFIWRKFGFCPTNITYKQRRSILKGKLDPYIFYKGL